MGPRSAVDVWFRRTSAAVATGMGNFCSHLLAGVEKRVTKSIIPRMDPDRTVISVTPDPGKSEEYRAQVDHSLWDQLMQQYVQPGVVDSIDSNLVDYPGMAEDPRMEEYRSILAISDVSLLEPNEQLCLYINAYNCLCIALVLDWYRKHNNTLPSSINDLSTSGSVWDLPAGVVAGVMYSLNQIEHEILRKRWKDPRVHGCIVCASASCPDLRTEAFVASRLNSQMDDQCTKWLCNPLKGVAPTAPLKLSRIMLWFKEDFDAVAASNSAWVSGFLPTDHHAKLLLDERPLYFSYSWLLNNL